MVDHRSPAGDAVTTRLARLSAAIRVEPPGPDLADAVHHRIQGLPVPVPRSGPRSAAAQLASCLHRHWRAATALGVAVLLGVLAVSPAGARIAEWLGLGAVLVQQDPAPVDGPPDPAAAAGFTELTLAQAADRAGFAVSVPSALGPPDRVLLGPGAAVVSMVWTDGDPADPGGPVRLDQLAGQPDYGVIKGYADDIEFTQVNGQDAFWLRAPHPLGYLDPGGLAHREPSRIAGPTLIWLDGARTLRLEGIPTSARALQIARSTG